MISCQSWPTVVRGVCFTSAIFAGNAHRKQHSAKLSPPSSPTHQDLQVKPPIGPRPAHRAEVPNPNVESVDLRWERGMSLSSYLDLLFERLVSLCIPDFLLGVVKEQDLKTVKMFPL